MNPRDVIGKTVEEAKKLTDSNKFKLRVVKEDGVPFGVTADYRLDRINVEVIKSKIVAAKLG